MSESRTKSIEIEPYAGSNIDDVIREAVKRSLEERCQVTFSFNDTPVVADASSLLQSIYARWRNDREGNR